MSKLAAYTYNNKYKTKENTTGFSVQEYHHSMIYNLEILNTILIDECNYDNNVLDITIYPNTLNIKVEIDDTPVNIFIPIQERSIKDRKVLAELLAYFLVDEKKGYIRMTEEEYNNSCSKKMLKVNLEDLIKEVK